jgi:SanA protein
MSTTKKPIRHLLHKVFFIPFEIGLLFILLTAYADFRITADSRVYVTSELREVPEMKVGLLLGTSRNLGNGKPNAFFFNRIAAAVDLYKNGVIQYILVSGDNSSADYNEPKDMRDELVLRGVPIGAIWLDYAGFRTLDSVIRARDVFGQHRYVVISQRFHNERAVFLARASGIEAYGYNAHEVRAYNGFKTKFREFFARGKVYIDLWFGVGPHFRK